MHIAIAGNIGSGKTTLTKMLAAHYGWTPKFESVDFNPYLADFYEDMERWSFNLQIYFLNKRFQDVVEISKQKDIIIQDRTIYEDARIFAPNLHAMGLMSTRDFENYSDLFDLMMSLVNPPDLLIYLRSSIPNLIARTGSRITRPASSSSTWTRSSSRISPRTSSTSRTRSTPSSSAFSLPNDGGVFSNLNDV